MDNTTYRLDAAEEKMFLLYKHAVEVIESEMYSRVSFGINIDNDTADFAVCNMAAAQYFGQRQAPSSYLAHTICLAMIKLIQVYAPKYSADLQAIIALKEGQRHTAKHKAKKPAEIDPSVGIDFYADTTTKS